MNTIEYGIKTPNHQFMVGSFFCIHFIKCQWIYEFRNSEFRIETNQF
jgi:hypothetical protein